jgi:hypothetical protein
MRRRERNHVDPLNRVMENLCGVPRLTFEVEVRVRARGEDGEIVATRGWETKMDPRSERLQVAVVGGRHFHGGAGRPRHGTFYRAPLPHLDERVQQALLLSDPDAQIWLDIRPMFFSYLDRSQGADGHWYFRGANPASRGREFRFCDGGKIYRRSVVLLAWTYIYGPLPEGARLVRTCSDPRCDNPSHHRESLTPDERSQPTLPRTEITKTPGISVKSEPLVRHEPTMVTKSMYLTLNGRRVIAQHHVPVRSQVRQG